MQNRIVGLVSIFFFVMTVKTVSADALINIRTKTSTPTTRPSIVSEITITAVPGHDFSARVEAGGNLVDLRGSLKPIDNGGYHVDMELTDRTTGMLQVKTNVDVTPGQPCELAGTKRGAIVQTTILTVTQKPESNSN